MKFFDLKDEQIYCKQELVLGVKENKIEKERGRFEKMMVGLEINEQEDRFCASDQVWVGGDLPTAQDYKSYQRFKGTEIDPEIHPFVFAWFQLVSMFSDDVMKSWK